MASANSRLNRKIRRLEESRENWRERVGAKQGEIRKLRVTVRDLQASRAMWKARALAAEAVADAGIPCTSQPPVCLPFVCPQPQSPDPTD